MDKGDKTRSNHLVEQQSKHAATTKTHEGSLAKHTPTVVTIGRLTTAAMQVDEGEKRGRGGWVGGHSEPGTNRMLAPKSNPRHQGTVPRAAGLSAARHHLQKTKTVGARGACGDLSTSDDVTCRHLLLPPTSKGSLGSRR
jgi:hypothetical protein